MYHGHYLEHLTRYMYCLPKPSDQVIKTHQFSCITSEQIGMVAFTLTMAVQNASIDRKKNLWIISETNYLIACCKYKLFDSCLIIML